MTVHVLLIGTNKFDVVPALLGRPDLRVTVLTETWYADRYRAHGLDDVHTVGRVTDHAAILDAAAAIHDRRPVDAILAPSERSVLPAAFLRGHLGVAGMSHDVALGFTAKHVMKSRLTAAGLPVAPFQIAYGPDGLARVLHELGEPAIVKPTFGAGGSGAAIAGTSAPLPTGTVVVERLEQVVREYHVNGIVTGGKTRFHAVARYLSPLLGPRNRGRGTVLLSGDHPLHDRLTGLHDATVHALGLDRGVTHLEVLETADGRLLIGEIAARPAGAAVVPCIELGYDLDFWRLYLDLETGAPIEIPSGPPHPAGVYMLGLHPGEVTAVSSADDLMSVAGVRRATVRVAVGDVISERFDTAGYGAYALFEPGGDRTAEDIAADLTAAWRLTTRGPLR